MKTVIAHSILMLLLFASITTAREIQKERIYLKEGENCLSLKGELKGYDIVDYQFQANERQKLDIIFKATNLATYFNVLPPGSNDVAMFVGSISGHRFEAELPVEGLYTIRIYMMRSAARRDETTHYTLKISTEDISRNLSTMPPKNSGSGKNICKSLELQGISFHISSTSDSSMNNLTIEPFGLEIDNSIIVREIDGFVTGVEVADLNADNSPEIYIYVTSAGSGSYGSLIAYSANSRKSLSEIYLPPLAEREDASKGYMGHDEFTVLEGVLGRRYPIYLEGDSNVQPTGGMRQLQYKLENGEAGWLLKLDQIIEF